VLLGGFAIGARVALLWPHNANAKCQQVRARMPSYAHSNGQAIIFLPCDFFYLLLLLSSFSSPNLSGRRLDVNHTSTHDVALVQIYNAGLKFAARGSLEMQAPKNRHLGTIAQLCRIISSQLRHVSTIGKNLLNSNVALHVLTIW